MLKNKKGAEKVISVYWFAILILVAGAISYMVFSFYGNPYDVRYIESNILISNVADCISDNGRLSFELNDGSVDLEKLCHINFDTGDNDIQYFIEIEFYDFNTNESTGYLVDAGNENLKLFLESSPGSSSVKLLSKKLYVTDNGRELIAKISTIINKAEENGKTYNLYAKQ